MALVVEAAEPLTFVADNWNSYAEFAVKPVIVALVAVIAGAVAVVQVDVPAIRYCNV